MSVPNKSFASDDFVFSVACDNAGIPATGRQAGKYRRGTGAAFAARPTAVDLGSLTVAALREACARSGIEVKSKARKATIVAALLGE